MPEPDQDCRCRHAEKTYGAGKTTAVRILATLVRPDGGHARVCGHDVVSHAHQVRQLTRLTGQYASVDESLTGSDQYQPSAAASRTAALASPTATATADRRVHVVLVVGEPAQPVQLLLAEQVILALLGQPGEVPGVRLAHLVPLPRLVEPLLTCSAAARVAPPAKQANRRHTVRARWVSRRTEA